LAIATLAIVIPRRFSEADAKYVVSPWMTDSSVVRSAPNWIVRWCDLA
jgi:hypothetical protein